MTKKKVTQPFSTRQLGRQMAGLRNQQGQSLVIMTFAMVALLVLMGLALDLGIVYGRRIQLARATDAAAMAAVIESSDTSINDLNSRASEFLTANGFPVPPAVVTAARVASSDLSSTARLVRVDAQTSVNTMFMHLVGIRTVGIQESSLAEFASPLETLVSQPTVVSSEAISPTIVYGIVEDLYLQVMGPQALAEWGDAYLPEELQAGVPNPHFNDLGGAYPFRIYIPEDYPSDELMVEILDPDSYGDMDGHLDQPVTETRYTLLYFDTDGYRQVIASDSWRNDSGTNLRWVEAFQVKLSDYPDIATAETGSKSLYLQVGTTEGGQSNGFHLWAGPPHSLPDDRDARNAELRSDPDLEDTGGVSILGQGFLPINVEPARTPITVTLAYIPPEAAEHKVRVYNFDLECAAGTQVSFYLEGVPAFRPQTANISCDHQWKATELQIPPAEGGFFGAHLRARYRDTTTYDRNESTWRLEYDDLMTQIATVRIVQ